MNPYYPQTTPVIFEYVEPPAIKILIPFYLNPVDQLPDFTKLGGLLRRTNLTYKVVINPNNGLDAVNPPSAAWLAGINAIESQVTRFVPFAGYVYLTSGDPSIEDIMLVIDGYLDQTEWKTDSIFFDEVPTTLAKQLFVEEVVAYARLKGAKMIILNPGTTPLSYMKDIADVIVAYEGLDTNLSATPRQPWFPLHADQSCVIINDYTKLLYPMELTIQSIRAANWLYITELTTSEYDDTISASLPTLLRV